MSVLRGEILNGALEDAWMTGDEDEYRELEEYCVDLAGEDLVEITFNEDGFLQVEYL